MMHILRSAPCFFLLIFHLMIYSSSLSSAILLTNFQNNVYPWPQATLPVNHGEIGIRSAVHLAPSAYLAAADRSSILICCILQISLVKFSTQRLLLPSHSGVMTKVNLLHSRPSSTYRNCGTYIVYILWHSLFYKMLMTLAPGLISWQCLLMSLVLGRMPY